MQASASFPVRPVIAFLTDFGLSDGYVGVMKGVVSAILPDAQLIDITHAIEPQNVVAAAWVLSTSYRYFPAGTVYTCVVDPGVGSQRHAIAMRAGEYVFVGPDNGLFSYILAQQPVQEVVALINPAYHLPQVSSTFQGRDIFSPAAAHVARGVALSELGPQLDPATLQRLDLEQPSRQGERITAQIAYIDHFGNLITNLALEQVPELFGSQSVELRVRGLVVTQRRRFFSEGSAEDTRPFLYADSSGHLAIAIRNGNAAQTLGIAVGEVLSVILTA